MRHYTNLRELRRNVRECHGQLYANKLDKLDEMDKFPKLTPEERENLNRPITSQGIESVITNLPTKKSPASDSIIDYFYQTFKELTPILLKLFLKMEEEGTLPDSFCE